MDDSDASNYEASQAVKKITQPQRDQFGTAVKTGQVGGINLYRLQYGDNTAGIGGTGSSNMGVSTPFGFFSPQQYQVDPSAANIDGYQNTLSAYQAAQQAAQGRAAPSAAAATIDQAQQAQWRNQQSSLAQMLMAQATGQGPSLAQMQAQRSSDQNMANALAMAQSSGGAGGAAAARMAANQRATMGQQLAADSGMLRLQEQQQAQGLLGNVLSGARSQDIGLATSQAGLNQQANLSNQQAQLQQTGLNDQLVKMYTQAGMDLRTAQMQARLKMQELQASTNTAQQALALQALIGNNQTAGQIVGAAGNVASLLAKSYGSGGGGGGATGATANTSGYGYGSSGTSGGDFSLGSGGTSGFGGEQG